MSSLDRFLDKVSPEPNSGCWLWLGGVIKGGYARIGREYAHRFSYEHFRGPIPEGLHIDHLCRVRSCVNPYHLEPVTQRENSRRGMAGKYPRGANCRFGHPLSGVNLYLAPKTGIRNCKECQRARVIKYRAKRNSLCILGDQLKPV